jgi:hypothetical protein
LLGFQLLSRFQLIVGFYEKQPGSVPIAHNVSFPQALFRTATEQLNIRHSVLPQTLKGDGRANQGKSSLIAAGNLRLAH